MSFLGMLGDDVAEELDLFVSFIRGNLSTIGRHIGWLRDLLGKYQELENYRVRGMVEDEIKLLEEIKVFKERENIHGVLEDIQDLSEKSIDGAEGMGSVVKKLKRLLRADSGDLEDPGR